MWLRDLINFSEKIALIVHHALPFPGFLIVIFLSWCETVYCLAHRLFPSETRAEETINQYIREHRLYDEQRQETPQSKVAIVTGANGGIGFETARAIGLAGYTTILACRNLKRGQQAQRELQDVTGLDTFVVMELDLSSFMSIERFTKQFMDEYSQLHLLVCNAGMAFSHYDTTYDGLESQFGTNYVGHYVLINHLLDMMKRSGGARITIASSISACMIRHIDYSRVTDVWRFDRLINYSTSKLALMVYSNALARQLKDTDVTVNAFHPGIVGTSLYRNVAFSMLPGIHEFRNWLWLDQKKGSITSIYLALSPELSGKSSGYYARQQPAVMHPDACNIKVQDRLCQFTEVLIATNTHSQSVLDSINSSRIVQ
ncbi:Retinol dehydrogenase 14 [Kickxella alabastrina]|uniref:Retinol dehydrogenase 14 n=1 Tax=Kickxella alabastrina TaxID=61397 RepID=A0ACC1IJJ4_9FUNG|nr:Retinol dehydrogenase 14 [Kickxella alabastrina]